MDFTQTVAVILMACLLVQVVRTARMLVGPSRSHRSEPINAAIAYSIFLGALALTSFCTWDGPEILLAAPFLAMVPFAPVIIERWRHLAENQIDTMALPASFVAPPVIPRSNVRRSSRRSG